MSATAASRLTGGIVASVLLHAGLVAAILFSRSPAPPPAPTMIRVSMLAAAPGPERAAGVVAAEPPVPKPPEPKPPEPKPVTAAPKVAAPTPKATKTPPKRATQTEAPKAKETPAAADAPKASGGTKGGRGTDVATIDTPGIEFDYPFYTTNIVRQLMTYFGSFNGTLKAEVQFVIHRDGSVDPQSIRLVTSSGNYSFDQRALGAVEGAANARKFGTLPGGFREDILPVTFWFSPQVIR